MFDTERFIVEIQTNECIWNKQAKSYHDLQAIHVAWTNVAKSCIENYDELSDKKKSEKMKDLKIKWKNIRDSYRKKCIKKSGQAASSNKKYIYKDILEFLRPSMENRMTEGNIVDSDDKDSDTESITTERHSGVEVSIEDCEVEESPRGPKIKKAKKSFENELISILKDRKIEEDPVTSFLMSLAPQIRALTQDQKNQVYVEFLQTIQKVKYSNNLNPHFQEPYQSSIPHSVKPYHPYIASSTSAPLQSLDVQTNHSSMIDVNPFHHLYNSQIISTSSASTSVPSSSPPSTATSILYTNNPYKL